MYRITGTSSVTVFGLTQVRAGSTAPSLNLTELASHHERDRYGNRTVMSQVVPGVPVPVRAPVKRHRGTGMSAWPAIVERWLLLGPRHQGEDDPRCSLAWAPLPSPSPPPSLTGCERCAVVGGDVCVSGFGCGLASGFGCGLARECVRLSPVERGAAWSGSQGAASESAAGKKRHRHAGGREDSMVTNGDRKTNNC